MSVILDALKKLDREKKSRRRRSANLGAEILRPDAPDRRKTILLYLGVAFVTAALTATLTYSLRREAPSRATPVPSTVAPRPVDQQVSAPPQPQPVLEIQNGKKGAPAVNREKEIEKRAGRKPPQTESKQLESRKEAVPPSREPTAPIETKAPEIPSTIPLSLKVSMIAWSEVASKRVAVVNEEVLGEGAEIKGVKIAEIGPKSVRFVHKGKSFEIPLGSSVSFNP